MFDTHLDYYLRRAVSTHALFHQALAYKAILAEAFLFQKAPALVTRTVPFREADGLPVLPLQLIVPHTGRNSGRPALCYSVVDFRKQHIQSWSVSLPSCRKTDALFRAHVRRYRPGYLRLRMPFMGLGIPHCSHMSKKGVICASNGFYSHVIDTRSNSVRIFPSDYLTAIPMHYSKQGNFSSDGEQWYFVRWPLTGWADIVDGKAASVPCEVGRVALNGLEEEILLRVDYQEETHEIACSPDDRHAVFCTFKQELCIPYPRASFFSSRHGYRVSHQAGMRPQRLVTLDLKGRTHWLTELPAPVIGHHAFDPDDPAVFYSSAHNVVFHEMSAILEGAATLLKLRIGDGKTSIEGRYSDSQFFRIFQHEVFKYRNETYIAVMSYPRYLYILKTRDMTLHKRVQVAPGGLSDFCDHGNILCEQTKGIYFTVNASEDGRFIVMGSDADFLMYDMETDQLIPIKRHLPKGFGVGESIPHTRTCGK